MYLLNFSFTIFIIITLLLYYSKKNLKVNLFLNQKNESLIEKQIELNNEIDTRKNTERELVSLLDDKGLLLKEINHRVKNNLAVISGLLELENAYLKDEAGSKVIKNNNNRIKAIALLHEQQYQDKYRQRKCNTNFCSKVCKRNKVIFLLDNEENSLIAMPIKEFFVAV